MQHSIDAIAANTVAVPLPLLKVHPFHLQSQWSSHYFVDERDERQQVVSAVANLLYPSPAAHRLARQKTQR